MSENSRKQACLLASIFFVVTILQGCSIFMPQSNDSRIERTASSQYVISTRPTKLDVSKLNNRDNSTVMSLVNSVQYDAALRSNGNSLGGRLVIDDPSTPIMNRLGDFFQKKYDLKFVARGAINNLDPDYLNRVLKEGDYVIDVRVSNLQLIAQSQSSLFYLTGTYQFSIIDHRRGRTLLQDECVFSDAGNAQSVRYFSASGGQNISVFLDKYATPCLRYFALGEPLSAEATSGTNNVSPSATQPTAQATTQQQSSPATHSASYTNIGLGTGFTSYGNVGDDGILLTDLNLSWTVGKKITNTNSFVMRTTVSVFETEGFPSFSSDSFYGTSLGVGTVFHVNGEILKDIEVLASGRVSQTLQSGVSLSTNALSIDLGAYYTLIGPLVGSVQYSYIAHLGQAEDTQSGGHRLGLSLAYKFHL